jgi:hypothetical protein
MKELAQRVEALEQAESGSGRAQLNALIRRVDDLELNGVVPSDIAVLRKEIAELALSHKQRVARGLEANCKSVNKFGGNAEIDSGNTADIWSRGLQTGGSSLIWVAPTQARTHTIASTDADDTTAGDGARTVKIWGLTSWTTTEVNETVTMNTGSPPVTSNSYVIIHRMEVITSGGVGGTKNQGLITATATGDGTVTAAIEAGEGRTFMAIYGIPSGETMYIDEIGSSVNKAGGAAGLIDFELLVNNEPDAQLLAFQHQHHWGHQTVGTSAVIIPFTTEKVIVGPAIIKIQAISGTDNMGVSAWFNGTVEPS